jgi:hypothetical protein
MSAFMVSREYIRYLVSAIQSPQILKDSREFIYDWYGEKQIVAANDKDAASRIGQVLWDVNLVSIYARYPNTRNRPDRIPGPLNEVFVYAHSRPWEGPIEPIQVVKACDCLAYQSCEFDGWEASEAFAILWALKEFALKRIDGIDQAGYKKAAWDMGELSC